MHRIRPAQRGVPTRAATRLQYAYRPQTLLCAFRSLHDKSGQYQETRHGHLNGYASSAIALGLVSLSIAWALYPSEITEPRILDERKFHSFTIVSKEQVSPTSSIYTLQPRFQPKVDPYVSLWATGLWSVEFKQPQLQIARSYTPLPPTETSTPGDLRFLVRREHKGEVSNYLDRLRVGAIIDVRGPRIEYEIPEDIDQVLFLAGGTGIAPALQVVHTLLRERSGNKDAKEKPLVHILWANRRREDCIGGRKPITAGWWTLSTQTAVPDESANKIIEELQDLERKYEGKLKIDYLVDEENNFIDKGRILNIANGSGRQSIPEKRVTKLLVLSGPEGFVNYIAGPKDWEDGKQVQGELGGILGKLDLDNWTVVKL